MFYWLTTHFIYGLSLAHWLVLVSAVLSLTGAAVYIRDMVRGKSKPNLVTWGLWALAPIIATGAALSADADAWATVRIFMSGFGPGLIFVTAFFISGSYWKLSWFDYLCGILSIVALVTWLIADSPVLAILLAAIADVFASLPTIKKAWKYPETETLYTHMIGLFTASIVIPAIPVWNIENAAFQVYLLSVNTVLFLTVLRGYLRRKKFVPQILRNSTTSNIRIASDEIQKFILAYIKDQAGVITPFIWSSSKTWHKDIEKEIANAGFEIERVSGGGKIKVLTNEKEIYIWGVSTNYGSFPVSEVTGLLESAF